MEHPTAALGRQEDLDPVVSQNPDGGVTHRGPVALDLAGGEERDRNHRLKVGRTNRGRFRVPSMPSTVSTRARWGRSDLAQFERGAVAAPRRPTGSVLAEDAVPGGSFPPLARLHGARGA